jgi:hypothetical protein
VMPSACEQLTIQHSFQLPTIYLFRKNLLWDSNAYNSAECVHVSRSFFSLRGRRPKGALYGSVNMVKLVGRYALRQILDRPGPTPSTVRRHREGGWMPRTRKRFRNLILERSDC